MPKEIDGEEYFTREEVEQQMSEKEEELQDKITEIESASEDEKAELIAEKERLEADLAGFKDKDTNFKQLRQKANEKSSEVETLSSVVKTTTEKLEQILEAQKTEVRNNFLASMKLDTSSKEDKELIDKIDFHFKKTGVGADTKEKQSVAYREAAILATQSESAQGNNFAATGPSFMHTTDSKTETDTSKEMRQNMGVSDDDAKKYDPSKKMPII